MSGSFSSLASLSTLITKGTTPTTLGYAHSDSGIPFLRVQNIFGGQVNFEEDTLFITEDTHAALKRSQIQGGDVLVTIAGTIGRTGVVPLDAPSMNCNQAVAIVRPTAHIERSYLRHWLESQAARSQMIGSTVTGTISNLSLTQLGELKVPLPPLEEQRRIAAILDQAETLRTQRRQALAHLETLTQSLFLDMFGDPVVNPKGWIKKPFGTVCETRLGKMLDAKQQTGANSRHYLRNANVQWFHIDTSDLLEMDFDADARETFRLHSGDLMICEGGEPGRAAIWRGELEDVYYQKALHRGRPKLDLINAEYLVWLLWFLSKRGGLGDHVTAATIAHLTGEKLKAMAIPVPPLPLQQTFATRIAAIEALKTTHRTAVAQLDALFASLQHRAFAGEL